MSSRCLKQLLAAATINPAFRLSALRLMALLTWVGDGTS